MGRSLVALVATLLLTAVAAPAVVAARDAPWDIKGLQPALRVAKLQAPTSKDGQRDLVGFSSQYFYREGAVMKFKIGGDGRRSELRFNEGSEWSLGTRTQRSLSGRLQVRKPPSDVDEFTWMQVHAVSKKPLLRLTWMRSVKIDGRKEENVLVAVLRKRLTGRASVERFLLAQRSGSYFDARIRVQRNRLRVSINGDVKVDEDVGDRDDGGKSYFKAGAYIQDGSSRVTVNYRRLSTV